MSSTPAEGDQNAQQDAERVADPPELDDHDGPDGAASKDYGQITSDAPQDLDILALDDETDETYSHEAEGANQTDENGNREREVAESLDDTGSLPDDTPSVQGSLRSSPRSETPSFQSPSSRKSSSGLHRPFDRRFQSRLSSYSLHSPRASSPAFLGSHSRHSSYATNSLPPPEPDESSAPWDVVRWHKMRKITGQAFSEAGKRSFGRPTCLAVTDNVVIGTSKGIILVFDQTETPRAIIGSGTKALECGAVTSLAISADHSTVAAGHASGHVFTWEIARSGKPFLHIPPIDISLAQGRRADGHVSSCAVLHIGFLGYRHTALVTADDRGMAFSHLATRGMGAVARTVRTTRILGRYPEAIQRSVKTPRQSSVLAFAPLPLGNVEQRTDAVGLVAMMTPYLLVIVSTTPIAQTQHKAARPKEVAAHSAMSAALAWFPAIKLKAKDSAVSKTKLVYCWSNVLTILEVEETLHVEPSNKERPPDLQFIVRSRYTCEEAIVGVQWISRSVIAVLTITQQLLILEDISMHMTDSFDLLPKDVYHADLFSQQLSSIVETLDEEDASMHGVVADAFHMSFRAYKGRLYLLDREDVSWGSLTNWADRLLALMASGDFVGAIKLATSYYAGAGEKVTIGLAEDDEVRSVTVREKLTEMMSASLKYAFGRNQQAGNAWIEMSQMIELASACVNACISIDDQDFLFDEVFTWFDENGQSSIFLDVIEPFILDGQISSLPTPAIKVLVDNFNMTRTSAQLEEIICLLDTSTMDIDQVTTLCKKYNLYDAYIYVWNKTFGDYTTPLVELLSFAKGPQSNVNGHTELTEKAQENVQKIFPYLSLILTSRTYPTGLEMDDSSASSAKTQIYDFFFSGTLGDVPAREPSPSARNGSSQPFDRLREILSLDTPSFISVLNEAFEDSFLNSGTESEVVGPGDFEASDNTTKPASQTLNRQYIVRIMLEVLTTPAFSPEDTIYLDMFIARSLPKYPQYILLSGTTLQNILLRLSRFQDDSMREDAQLSVEYLMSIYHPPDLKSLVPVFRQAQFYRVLKTVFRQEQQYADYIATYFIDEDDQKDVFGAIFDCLGPGSSLGSRQRGEVIDLIRSHVRQLVAIDVERSATTIDKTAPELHQVVLNAEKDCSILQFDYLHALLEPTDITSSKNHVDSDLRERYVQLMCQYRPSHVSEYLDTLKVVDLRAADVLPAMERHGIVDAAVVLLARQGQAQDAMDRLVKHLKSLRAALNGILQGIANSPDTEATHETVTDLLESSRKYTRMGIWLCRDQTNATTRRQSSDKSTPASTSNKQHPTFVEKLWLDLINVTITMSRDPLQPPNALAGSHSKTISLSLRGDIQEVFTAFLAATAPSRDLPQDRSGVSFLRVLRAFLSQAAEKSPSLAELRSVLRSIFSAYAHEESLLSLANTMLDKDVFVHVDEVSKLRLQGWRPRGQICEVCRRRVWGPGIGSHVWSAWKRKENERLKRRLHSTDQARFDEDDLSRGKGKGTAEPATDEEDTNSDKIGNHDLGPVLIFSCRHIYHQKCLGTNQGSERDAPFREGLRCSLCA